MQETRQKPASARSAEQRHADSAAPAPADPDTETAAHRRARRRAQKAEKKRAKAARRAQKRADKARRRGSSGAAHHLDGYRVIPGNRVALLVDGAEAYPAMLDAIATAQHAVILETYTFAPDATGRRFVQALAACARRGVSVRLLVDGFGSSSTPLRFLQPIEDAGGRVCVYHPLRFWRPERLTKRDHRKILAVDARVGFIGGLNISDDYAPASWGGQAWHDTQARLEGPAVRALTKMFNKTWRRVTGEDWNTRLQPSRQCGDVPVQILESRITQRHTMRRAYVHAIKRAEKRICIANAYFIPDRGIRRALRNAVRRGVSVQLLLPGYSDVFPVRYASRALYGRLMQAGVEIYEWRHPMLHAKSAVIDGLWCSVGSFNLDRRSLMHNLEANIACVDPKMGAAMEAQFSRDLGFAQRIDPRVWHRRSAWEKLLERVFYSVRHLL